MKQFFILIIFFFFSHLVFSQISHGGQPLFPPTQQNLLKSSDNHFFIEMPAFDLEELLKEDQLNKGNMRGSFRFAKKFDTSIERGKDGLNYQLPDGTKVWQVGIRSTGAYSINVLFSEFHIPEGGKLFLYNSNRTHVIGSFTYENNSEDNILPVQPIKGDEIIIEYTEPSNAAFQGVLKISEVNHDYVNLLAYEPKNDPVGSACMPDVICQSPDDLNNRSTLLLVINGVTACTGTLINNTSQDGKPYVLTASHCLNKNFAARSPDDYIKMAGTIVTFFNYSRPVCSNDLNNLKMKGIEEMSLAGAKPVCVIDTCDITLIQMNDTPPDYYLPYYAGWNIDYNKNTNTQNLVPYSNHHHPSGGMQKFGQSLNPLTLTRLSTEDFSFLPASHWRVNGWNIGSTGPGSSGSPLFNNQGQIVGGLSGGKSECNKTEPNNLNDYFFALFRGWDYGNNPENQLKYYLDPTNSGAISIDGFDPYKLTPMVILSNANYNSLDKLTNSTLSSPGTGAFFGHNSLKQFNEFAEEFYSGNEAEVVGAYIMTPTVLMGSVSPVKINVYKDKLSPGNKIDSILFYPQYTTYQTNKFTDNGKNMSQYPVESFAKFNDKLKVKGRFFISYEITYPSSAAFSVYNTTFASTSQPTTAWIKNTTTGGWIKANEYAPQPIQTSLAIQAMINYSNGTGIESPISTKNPSNIHYYRSSKQLSIDASSDESGIVELFSITGQLIQRFSFSGGTSTWTLQGQREGSVGIVRVFSNKNNGASKIIF